jgi:hypothetical protein
MVVVLMAADAEPFPRVEVGAGVWREWFHATILPFPGSFGDSEKTFGNLEKSGEEGLHWVCTQSKILVWSEGNEQRRPEMTATINEIWYKVADISPEQEGNGMWAAGYEDGGPAGDWVTVSEHETQEAAYETCDVLNGM